MFLGDSSDAVSNSNDKWFSYSPRICCFFEAYPLICALSSDEFDLIYLLNDS